MKAITKSLIIIAALSAAISCNSLSISSPDGSLTVKVSENGFVASLDGEAVQAVEFEDGKEIVSESSDSKLLKIDCLPRGGFAALVITDDSLEHLHFYRR